MNLITDIYPLNEISITIVFGDEISLKLADRIAEFNQALIASPFSGFLTTIPAYASITVYYDPIKVYQSNLNGSSCFDKVSTYIRTLKTNTSEKVKQPDKVIIPVYYGGKFGPDIDLIAAQANLSTAEVIQIHCAASYRVYMIGFVPGFAYMGGMDKRLSTPRRQQPRASVPAGAVGIAGEQTGIYPLDIPGGWQIIGQTPLKIFDANRPEPALLKAGDEIRFEPITIEQFRTLS